DYYCQVSDTSSDQGFF
nr:immunoglobulin light chain junction region [Macaca mulatta]